MRQPAHDERNATLWLKLGSGLFGVLLVLVIALAFFPWDVLRGPLNRYVSEKTGRHFEVTRRLDLHPGWRGLTVEFDGIEFANPDWAREPYLLRAERAEFEIALWPLFSARKLVLPRMALTAPQLALQIEPDGRRTWALGKDTSDTDTVPRVGVLQVDRGTVDFLASEFSLDLHADVDFDAQRGDMPLHYRVKGQYRHQDVTAQGRTGDLLHFSAADRTPIPMEIEAATRHGRINAKGTVADLSTLDGIDADFDVRGQNLGNLYVLLGVALPHTPPYRLSGRLHREGHTWDIRQLKGQLGLSDIEGEMRIEQSRKLPLLSGELRSRVMDMDDLGPFIGLAPTTRSANAIEGVAPPTTLAQTQRASKASRKVLPTGTLDLERLRAMDADVKYTAERIRNVHDLPLENGHVHVKLDGGVLSLEPLVMGLAGGELAGAMRIDGTQDPADMRASLDIRRLRLDRLIPKVETLHASLNRLDGRINLSGRGSSIATWLAGASGDVAVITGRGEISNLLLEYLGLDGAEILKFWLRGDRKVLVRCGALAFDVNKGAMTGRTLMLDTADTAFTATGRASLADETLDFVVRPEPKDKSIFVARTPLVVRGTFAAPSAGVKKGPLIVRGAVAVALGAINPLLAIAATVETGPGKDADCQEVLAQAKAPTSGAAATGAAKAKAARNSRD
ncbi:AsmA family protein [Variovorax sp. J22R133]|uniref:AsmA family protein n=1 Tax=Variovorax brevis TaxID=3053503 RepID=UPI0025758C56|nr:AsmA family protein [Variovorax sp. J22R133]MDM0112921.1 AsmA family protein [Variovorax sp. J22R133]